MREAFSELRAEVLRTKFAWPQFDAGLVLVHEARARCRALGSPPPVGPGRLSVYHSRLKQPAQRGALEIPGRRDLRVALAKARTLSYKVRVTEAVCGASADSEARTVIVDRTAPWVVQVAPAEGATGIAPCANLSALFSEEMQPTSVIPSPLE